MQTKLTNTKLNLQIQSPQNLKLGVLQSSSAGSGTSDYSKLTNLPFINDVLLKGHLTNADLKIVSEDTVDGWNKNCLYVPKLGEVVIYTDRNHYVDDDGNDVVAPDIKIGDGHVPVVDLPFLSNAFNGDVKQTLINHTSNSDVHVSENDRARWDAKLNYRANGETLIFTTE